MSANPIALLVVAAAATLSFAGSSRAAITVYTTAADFVAGWAVVGTDGFANLSPGTTDAGQIQRTAGGFAYGASTNNGFYVGGSSADSFLSTLDPIDSIRIALVSPLAMAIGGNFFASGFAGFFSSGPVSVTAFDASGFTKTITLTPGSASAGSFLGFSSNTRITQVWVSAVQGRSVPGGVTNYPSVDNLIVAGAVPEPGAWAMLAAGLAAVGWRARRSNRVGASLISK